MSFQDLCECICSVIRRHQSAANSILQSVSGQQAITSQGFASTEQALGLPSANTNGLSNMSNSTLLAVTFAALFVVMLFTMNRGKRTNVVQKPTQRPPPNNFFDPDSIH